jgi:putative flavoprotein involved in K+ transport
MAVRRISERQRLAAQHAWTGTLPPAAESAVVHWPGGAAFIVLTDVDLIDMCLYVSADLEPVARSAAPVIVVGGGQSGLAAARALRGLRMPTVILEASDRPAGSWPRYYDSLRLFSPAGYSSMPGMPFPGPPDRYPGRDEVAGYLGRYAARLDVEIQTGTRVQSIRQDGREFIVVTEGGRALRASGIVAASGSFSNPYRPGFPGEDAFTGELSHVADYRNPAPYAGQRVIVVGAGDSAAQVANELAPVATVTLATRHPVRFIPQRLGGQDVHYWLRESGFDTLPAEWLGKITGGSVVTDSVGFQQTLADGRVDQRPMFTALDGNQVVWSDGQREPVDAIILATGYRPSLDYLGELGALDPKGAPIHVRGISSTHVGLVYLGLEHQRSFASNTLRGVSQDARAVIPPLAAWIRDAPAKVGLGTRDHVDTCQSERQVQAYGRGTRANPEDQAPRRRTAPRAGRLPRGAAPAGNPHGRGRQGARRPRPAAAH